MCGVTIIIPAVLPRSHQFAEQNVNGRCKRQLLWKDECPCRHLVAPFELSEKVKWCCKYYRKYFLVVISFEFVEYQNSICPWNHCFNSSANGSPVDKVDEGSLVATVTKKRKGNAAAAAFDINLGEGNYISLSDPTGIQNLDDNMKSNAVSQLKVLQDQMALLMGQLTTNSS